MRPIDFHTHHVPGQAGSAIVSTRPEEFNPQPGHWYSVGIHPWYPDSDERLLRLAVRHPQVLAVGEAGLDKLCHTPLSMQQELFRQQALLAEEVGKPLVIHLVRATDELLAIRKELHPRQPWIIHGFRGKASLAATYLRHGLSLSIGSRFQSEALASIPIDRLFLETDESRESIDSLYQRVATLRGMQAAELQQLLSDNLWHLCGRDSSQQSDSLPRWP